MLVPGLRSGTNMNCPSCNALFTIPIVLNVERPALDLGVTCVHCEHKNAPGTSICRRCGSDLVTGKRAPLGRRLSLWVERRWPFVTAGSVIVLAVVFVLVRILGGMARPGLETPKEDPNQTQEMVPVEVSLAAALFAANDPNAQTAVFDQVLSQGPAIQAALANELKLYAEQDEQAALGDAAAELTIEAFITLNHPDEAVLAVLRQISSQEGFGKAAMLARGDFGDVQAAPALSNWWLALLERELYLSALVEDENGAPVELVTALVETRDERRQVTQALRRLVQDDALEVLSPLAERYWRSWRWLGQTHGEAFADALFELAMPYRGRSSVLAASEQEAKEAIRAARRTLSQLGEEGAPLVAAAAGIAMVRNAPQYESARDRIVEALLTHMSDLPARDQQRVIWAMARLTGRLFGSYGSDSPPWEVTPQVGAEVVNWALKEHGIKVTLAEDTPWMRPVVLEYRIAAANTDPNTASPTE